ncbi:hypothetical protein H2200_002779 [Cladophialophora chaetospira]|uniref:Uncharacterized protein n=1 Tax=Cladophialophora chaetospira TaxID=386627 RepID=A0AA38XJI5_9EURO|nr:hypothetical protein H2200_002779 [Cladophialophora chaetospira]
MTFRDELNQSPQHDTKRKTLSNFDEVLHAARVREMKQVILREVLAETPYLSEDTEITSGGLEKKSRIPVRAKDESELQRLTDDTLEDTAPQAASVMDDPVAHIQAQARSLGSLRDLILVISAYLYASLDASSGRVFTNHQEELLSDDIERFREGISAIAEAMSLRLSDLESSIANIANLTLETASNKEQPQHPVPPLSEIVQIRLATLQTLRTSTLPSSLATLNTILHSLLSAQRKLLHLQLQHLETSKHGILSRYHASKIAFLSTVAQTIALKTQVMVLEAKREIESSPEVERRREGTRVKMEEMEREEQALDERIRLLEGAMGEYEALDIDREGDGGGLEVMRKLGRRYAEIEEETEVIKRDIEILKKKGKV